jgi:hypothetical protein
MSVITEYFAADSDEAAAAMIDDGPAPGGDPIWGEAVQRLHAGDKDGYLRLMLPRVRETETGRLVMQSKGILPDNLLRLQHLLTGIASADPVLPDVATDGDFRTIVGLTLDLQNALAGADDEALAPIAEQWAQEDFPRGGQLDGVIHAVLALASLCRQASARGERVYCLVAV